MINIKFNLQRFADVIHGKASKDNITATGNNTQVYGLAGSDNIESNNNNNVILIGGSGDDTLKITGGSGTLNGGKGSDTFKLSYSNSSKLSAVIEDIDPNTDKLIINYNGSGSTPNLNYNTSGSDIVITDNSGSLNVTLKGSREVNDYYDDEGNDKIWDILKLVNAEREKEGLSQLILSQELMRASSIRENELTTLYSHTRPNGESCFTAINKTYGNVGENIAAGYTSTTDVMNGWMNSTGHRANILNSNFKRLGAGYSYSSNTYYEHYWVQMFGGDLWETENIEIDNLLKTKLTLTVNDSIISNSNLKDIANLELTNINGTSGDDLMVNGKWYGEKGNINVIINGGNGNDTITNSGYHSVLNGGSGNDLIYNGYYYYDNGWIGFLDDSYNSDYNDEYGSANTTIEGGVGNDTIKNKGDKTLINGGSGDDDIEIKSSDVTINGGNGNDIINIADSNSKNNLIQYYSGDGSDTIYGYDSNDTIQILTGNYTTTTSGQDIIINVDNGSIILKNSSDKELNIVGNTIPISNDTISNSTSNTVINGTSDDDKILNTASGSYVTVNASSGNDTIDNRGTCSSISGGAGDDSIISSSGSYATINGGSGNDTITGSSYTDVFQYADGDGNDVITGYSSADTIKITNGTYSTQISGDDVIVKVGSGSITLKNANGTTLNIEPKLTPSPIKSVTLTNSDKTPYTAGSNIETVDASKRNRAIKIKGNSLDNSITGGSGADSLSGLNGDDTLNGGKGNDTLIGGNGNDVFIYASGQGNDVITDYKAGEDTIKITGKKITNASVSGSDVILKVGTGSIKIKNGKGKTLSIYNNSNSITDTIISDDKGKGKRIENYHNNGAGNHTVITGTAYNDTIYNSADYVKINAGDGNDSIYSSVGYYATINGGKGNDTIYGSSYADVFQYSDGDGNDVIYNYDTKDKISLSSSSSYSTAKSGSDTIINVGSGSIRIKSTGNNKLKITGGKKTSTIDNDDTSTTKGQSFYNSTKNKTVNGTSGKDSINNSAGGVKIYSGAGNDSIYSSVTPSNTVKSSYGYVTIDGGAGNDTIYSFDPNVSINGGVGNDTIDTNGFSNVTVEGGAGNDTINLNSSYSSIIQYSSGDGNDIIQGYTSSDTIRISGSSYSTQTSGSDLIIKVGSGKMTLKNFAYLADDINVIGTRNFEEHWFTENDNNFITSEFDSILDNNSNFISSDYNYDSISTLTKKLNQTFSTNSNKQQK